MTENLGGVVPATEPPDEFIRGMSPAILSLENVIAEIAPTTIPVMLLGESGTGKQMVAQHIHALSGRSAEPFQKVGCAALTRETLPHELGLHANGNGNGARGAVGTILFDEISELETSCQRDLLYALPDGEANPAPGSLRARVISATSRNLDEEMRAGRFRSDLFYRINGVCLRLPPLRERKEDIQALAEHFLSKHSARLGRPRPSLSQRALQMFFDHSWPGNVRELENTLKALVALGDEQVALAELAATPDAKAARPSGWVHSLKAAARAASREAERELILKALARTRWNRKRAAQELQISYKSLLYKLKQIGAEEPEAV